MEQTKNYFETLSEVKCVTEKRKSGGAELTYVSWADAWADLKKIHPDAKYTIYEDANGFPFWASKYGIDVKVGVTVKGLEHIVRLPVMDGNNNAMKDEEYEYEVKGQNGTFTKKVAAADTFDINKAIQRCFAKACAMHGLGLYVYRGEDLPDGVEKVVTNVSPKSSTVSAKPITAPAQTKELEWMKDHELTALLNLISEGKYDGKNGQEVVKLARLKYKVNREMASEIDEAMASRVGNDLPKKDLTKEAGSIFKDPKVKDDEPKIEDVPF